MPRVKIYSHSRLTTFEQCPLRYKLKYLDKIKPEIECTIEAHLGSCVHSTLEWIYNSVKKDKKVPTIDEIITYYSVKWQDEFSNEILIVKKELNEKDYFNKGIEFLINYYTKHHPFKDGTIECEKRIFIHLDENTKILGFIDRLVHDIETGNLEIHDYKTSNMLPTQEKIDEDRQLALYSIAIKEIYGKNKEIVLVWHYLAHNQKIISKRTNEQLENLKERTKKLIKNIEATKNFPYRKSALCDWCGYKGVCPAWNPNSPHKTLIDQSELSDFEINNGKELDIWD